MDTSYDAAMEEWELIAFDVVAGLLDKLGLSPTDVSSARIGLATTARANGIDHVATLLLCLIKEIHHRCAM